MGLPLSLGRGRTCGSCIRIAMKRKHPRVLQVVKPDGTVLKFSSPILVRDVPADTAISGIGPFEGSPQNLPPDYELKLGEVYYVLPPRVKRIKVVITKQQFQLLLDQRLSVEEVMAGVDRKQSTCGGTTGGDGPAPVTWRPSLETIPEGID
ncbi:hypothetical protein SAY87_011745 [Trapa incisa]|uniref:Uncharacterized protein n=1 Tax=Trapa incisa TaxID=236973 RepID=A0AAN7JJJ6_9MYRT|nr:hypothetical protein SAY87_011745 [Trapa incisa]